MAPPTTKPMHLSIQDQTIVRAYIRTLHLFSLPSPTDRNAATAVLKSALQATLTQLPVLSGTVGPADPDTGKITAQYPSPIPDVVESGIFAHRISTTPSFEYTALKHAGFPPSVLTGQEFCPQRLRNLPGVESPIAEGHVKTNVGDIPILATEAVFVPGGLVLSVYAHHSLVDGGAYGGLLDRLAENTGLMQMEGYIPSTDIPDPSARRKELDQLHNPTAFPNPICPEFGLPNSKKPTYTPTRPNTTVVGKIFIFPAAKISALREQLAASTGCKVSSFVTLAALVWVHTAAVRASSLSKLGHSESRMGFAVDCRSRVGFEEYDGNFALYTIASLPLEELSSTGEKNKPPTMHLLQKAVKHITAAINETKNENWVEKRIAYLNQLHDPRDLSPTFNAFITSWMHMGSRAKWCIPGTNTAVSDAVRKPWSTDEGGNIVLPRRGGGGDAPFEVLIQLVDEDMVRLEGMEGGLMEWVERVVM